VPTLRLDDSAAEHGIERVDAMKIDVEGAELKVLCGAERLLRERRIRFIQCEAVERLAQAMGYSTVDVKRLLRGHGYAAYLADHPDGGPVETDTPHTWANLLFLPEGEPPAAVAAH
jgi:hypothetical protein